MFIFFKVDEESDHARWKQAPAPYSLPSAWAVHGRASVGSYGKRLRDAAPKASGCYDTRLPLTVGALFGMGGGVRKNQNERPDTIQRPDRAEGKPLAEGRDFAEERRENGVLIFLQRR
ncbi:hypothetical protein [Rhodovibrio sodomensis]|uniref:hypothetical protein n=1 Tax=Rhodovibrio sodomensis TaxID=1088 RepID=UPI001905669D|nr:hypothetical protein [Rhodovibrio sodomensis]